MLLDAITAILAMTVILGAWLAVLAAWRRVFPGLSADEDALAGRISCHDCPRETLCNRLDCDAGNTKPNHNRTT